MSRVAVPKLSAVIPSYCEAASAPILYERLVAVFEALNVKFELIFVNSGSPDDTGDVLAKLAARDRRVTVINHSRAFGPQGAYTSGMRLATGDAVILLDGDLQDPPELIREFVARWREGYDVVYGVRTRPDSGPAMRLARRLFYRLFKRLSYVAIPVDAGEFSLLDRRVVDAINELPETQRFVRGLRAWVGFRQIAVPYVRADRTRGKSNASILRYAGVARQAILSFSYVPLDAIGWLALITTGAAGVGMLVTVVLKVLDPSAAPRGFATLFIVILFVGGIQLLCLSVIGSYLAQMYEEIKARPSYVVESVLNDPRERERPEARPAEGPTDDVADERERRSPSGTAAG